MRPFFDFGGELFHRRQGQLNLSCSQCHDDNWGKRLAGAVIPQGHPTGYRRGNSGELIPRDIIHTLICTYNGEEVFRADLHPAIAANPFLSFFTLATESGVIALTWTDDHGQTQTEVRQITVE